MSAKVSPAAAMVAQVAPGAILSSRATATSREATTSSAVKSKPRR
jgi:hypothetical protein